MEYCEEGFFQQNCCKYNKSERKRWITIKMRGNVSILCLRFEVYAIDEVVSGTEDDP